VSFPMTIVILSIYQKKCAVVFSQFSGAMEMELA
jgi:hypothetical protein